MRGDQLSRQWRILRKIEASKYGLTAAEIAELGGVSLKTGYRDLDDLQLAGFPLYTVKIWISPAWSPSEGSSRICSTRVKGLN